MPDLLYRRSESLVNMKSYKALEVASAVRYGFIFNFSGLGIMMR